MDKSLLQILLIEDNPVDAIFLEASLEKDAQGAYQINKAERLSDGLKILQDNRFDVILLDLGLPDSQGLDTFQKIHRAANDVPVVVLSGLMDEDFALQAVQAGAQDYLVKGTAGWEFISRSIRYAIERHNLYRSLQESERRFSTVFQANPASQLIATVTNGVILDINEAFCHMVGYSEGELIGHTTEDLHLWANPDDLQKITQAIRSDECVRDMEINVRARSGEIRTLLASVEPIKLNGEKCILSTSLDITERKRMEIAIRDILANLEAAEEQARLGSWHFDTRTNKGWWSRQMYQLFGLDPERGIPGNEEYLEMIHPEDRGLLANTLVQMSQGVPPEKCDFRIHPKNGAMRVLSPQYHMEKDQDGKIVRFSGTALDITERKQAEEEIRSLNEDLEARVIERTSQLAAANKELESFSYSVSHDLRAPLRAINGYANILAEDYGSRLDEEGMRVCGVINRETQRMGKLIDDLLAFSRLGRKEMRPNRIDMQALVDSVLNDLLREEDKNRLDIQVGLLHSIDGDPALMRQVWVNLLSNAIKFTSKKKRAVIEVQSSQDDGEVIYSVRDNGAGFDMEYANKLFGVFQRLHGESEFEGTGVGLAIVQRVIRRHEGRVWAEGKVNEGAVFHFALPGKAIGND